MSEYESALARIKKAHCEDALARVEMSFEFLWDSGVFTLTEFIDLDHEILNRYAELENA